MKVKPPEKALFPPGAAGEERSPELAVCGTVPCSMYHLYAIQYTGIK